jgi:NarL family two-component system response regulator LiaR
MSCIKIGIVEDDPQWQKILSNFLNAQDDFQVIWVASEKDTAISLARETKKDIDVILMDLNLSFNERDGIYATFEICSNNDIKIIVLTSYAEGQTIRDAFTAGAVNYIVKENLKDLPNAIRSAIKGKSPIEELLSEYKDLKKELLLKQLTRSERKVFDLLEKGKSKTEIIEMLYKTENTVKSQINSILKKLNAKTSKDAIEKVKRKGIK